MIADKNITIDKSLTTISSYWSGPKLGWMQLACLSSFAMRGHHVILYTDNHDLCVPDFIDVRSSDHILPLTASEKDTIPVVLKSDIFRLRLFETQNTIWADTDAYCTMPFKFSRPHVFGMLEKSLATGVLRLPNDSPVLKDMIDFALNGADFPHWLGPNRRARAQEYNELDPLDRLVQFYHIRNGILGPRALNYYAKKHRIGRQAFPEVVFYPVTPKQSGALFSNGSMNVLKHPRTVSVHFYGRAVGNMVNGITNNIYSEGSFAHYAFAKTQHLWQNYL